MSSGYYLVLIPNSDESDRELLETFATGRLHPRATVHELERDAAVAAGACDACPVGCASCTGERSGCECYEHDTPE